MSSPENRLSLWGQSSLKNYSIHWQLSERLWQIVDTDPDSLKGLQIPKSDRQLKEDYCLSVERPIDLQRELIYFFFCFLNLTLLQEAFPSYEGWSKNLLTPKFQLLLLGSLVFWTEGGENMMRNVLGIYVHILCIYMLIYKDIFICM